MCQTLVSVSVPVGSGAATGRYKVNGSFTTLQGTNFVPYNTTITAYLDQPNNFTFTSDNPAIRLSSNGNSTSFTIPSSVSNGFKITATATDGSCWTGYYIFVPTGYAYVFAPNPASTDLTVTDTSDDPADAAAEPFDADLYDTYGKKVKTKKSERGKAVLNVRDVPDGLYNLRAGKGKKVLSEHVQITH